MRVGLGKLLGAALTALVMSSGVAVADCASMWLTRNLVFDRAGYCFGSTLGQAIFDNGDCTPGDVTLTLAEREFVAHTRATEAEFDCKIDTSRSWLEIDSLGAWMQLQDMPWRDLGESGCIGWKGARLALRAAAASRGPVIGQIMPGDVLIFGHYDIGDFSFVEVVRNGQRSDLGWVNITISPKVCDSLAG